MLGDLTFVTFGMIAVIVTNNCTNKTVHTARLSDCMLIAKLYMVLSVSVLSESRASVDQLGDQLEEIRLGSPTRAPSGCK